MNRKELNRGLIAFKGNTFIYARKNRRTAEPVYFSRKLSFEEMSLIEKNPALLHARE